MSAPVQFSLKSGSKPGSTSDAAAAAAIFAAASTTTTPPARPKITSIPLPPSQSNAADDVPMLLRNVNPDVLAADDKDKCRVDVAWRPEAPDQAAYDRVPVHEFGYALLAGMGWSKGKPIGKSNPQVVEPFEYLRRPHLLGLGAAPTPSDLDLPSMTKKKRRKRDDGVRELVDPETGKTRYRKGIDEVLMERDRPLSVGDRVRIASGPYANLTGVVNAITDAVAEIALDLNQKPIRVELRQLVRAETPASVTSAAASSTSRPSRPITWVVPDLIVRIISKSARWQRWYSCKGRVYDVVSRTRFTVMVDGALVEDLTEADVETVVPDRPGVRLRIVGGSQRGQSGRLYRRMLDKGKAKVDLDDGQRIVVALDDVTQVAD